MEHYRNKEGQERLLQKLYDSKVESLEVMDKHLDTYGLPKLKKTKRQITNSESKSVIKVSQQRKAQQYMAS